MEQTLGNGKRSFVALSTVAGVATRPSITLQSTRLTLTRYDYVRKNSVEVTVQNIYSCAGQTRSSVKVSPIIYHTTTCSVANSANLRERRVVCTNVEEREENCAYIQKMGVVQCTLYANNGVLKSNMYGPHAYSRESIDHVWLPILRVVS